MSNRILFLAPLLSLLHIGCGKTCDSSQHTSTPSDCSDTGAGLQDSECKIEYSLAGELESTALNFTTFAWAELNNGSVLVLGFPEDRENKTDACSLIEEHVSGSFWWHDGAITELRISGEWESGGQFAITDNPADSDNPLNINLVTSVMDEWNDYALGGSALLEPFSVGEPIIMTEIETISETGGLRSTGLTACYCASVRAFWDVVPPDDTNDSDSDDL